MARSYLHNPPYRADESLARGKRLKRPSFVREYAEEQQIVRELQAQHEYASRFPPEEYRVG